MAGPFEIPVGPGGDRRRPVRQRPRPGGSVERQACNRSHRPGDRDSTRATRPCPVTTSPARTGTFCCATAPPNTRFCTVGQRCLANSKVAHIGGSASVLPDFHLSLRVMPSIDVARGRVRKVHCERSLGALARSPAEVLVDLGLRPPRGPFRPERRYLIAACAGIAGTRQKRIFMQRDAPITVPISRCEASSRTRA